MNWRFGDLEELRAQLRADKTGEQPSAELGGQSATAANMPLEDADMDECPLAERTGTRRPTTPPRWGPHDKANGETVGQ